MSDSNIIILPGIERFFMPYHPISFLDAGTSAGGSTFRYQQGYGQLSKAGATVMQGVTGTVHIDLKITTLSEEFYEATTKQITTTVSQSVRESLRESSEQKDYKSWWFAFLAGGGSSGHSSQHYRDQQSDSVTITDTKVFNDALSRMNSEKKDFHVSGDFTVTGQSYLPTTVFLFIETLTIQVNEGQSIMVPTQNIAVADEQGYKAGTTKDKINITPLF